MNRFFVFITTLIISFAALAQTNQKITLEDIFEKNAFQEQTISGLRSTKDGEHYTTLENNSKIVKYSYKL